MAAFSRGQTRKRPPRYDPQRPCAFPIPLVARRDLGGVPETPLPEPERDGPPARHPIVYVVDSDRNTRDAMYALLAEDGRTVRVYASAAEFLEVYRPGRDGCLVVDGEHSETEGLVLLETLRARGERMAIVLIDAKGDVSTAVQAMRAGAFEVLEKPVYRGTLLASVERAMERSRCAGARDASRQSAASRIAALTPRQRQILDGVLAGRANKNIAADLGISQRTVESHRATIMKNTGATSIPALARLAIAAAFQDGDEPFGRDPAGTIRARDSR